MKVRYQAADQGGCGHYRLIWPAEALANQGHDVAEATPLVDPDTDVIVIQRPLRAVWADEVIPQLHRAGIAVVVEIDDDFHAIDPSNIAWRACHPKLSPDSNWDHLARAAGMADLVTVSTPALAARYGGIVLRNMIPEQYLTLRPEKADWLGWTGSIPTHPGDLDVARVGVQQALRANPQWGFLAVGGDTTLQTLGVTGNTIGWQPDILDYARTYASLSAAIVPLARNPFNEAKSWLKGLEAAALGVPFVATPTSEYTALREHGIVGIYADRARDWTRTLTQLLADDQWRADLAAAGTEAARELTIESHAWRWMEVWALARAHYKTRTRTS